MKENNQRRVFLKQSILASIGLPMVFSANFPLELTPVGLFEADIEGKSSKIRVLNDRPVNAETPAHLLDDNLTPNDLFFVRNNGIPPTEIDINKWKLTIEGESAEASKSYTIQELKDNFKHHTLNLTLECGGNGRSEFNPPAKGNQWSTGAVGCASWTGVKLADVLQSVGVKSDAVYIGYIGKDTHLSGDPEKLPISRGVPIDKAMEAESLIAWSMNGEDIPIMNGYPLRLVFGGYPASCSGKWLSKILVRNQVHDGPKMEGQSYRIPCDPVAPGAKVADEDMCIIENMPVKSIITYPKTGATIKTGQSLEVRGKAWTSAKSISKVECSIDFGRSWTNCTLKSASNRYEWQTFNAKLDFPQTGYYEVWAKATDSEGQNQPIILPGWNPKGYLNNACHRIAIKVVS
jgi:DMSO/TMAO reductase YedYZ molybdopterin-dependent catalytic subunit